jgi:hypothetical protein
MIGFESGLERDFAQLAIGLDFLGSKQNVIRLEANGIKGSATTQYGIEGSWSLFFKLAGHLLPAPKWGEDRPAKEKVPDICLAHLST